MWCQDAPGSGAIVSQLPEAHPEAPGVSISVLPGAGRLTGRGALARASKIGIQHCLTLPWIKRAAEPLPVSPRSRLPGIAKEPECRA